MDPSAAKTVNTGFWKVQDKAGHVVFIRADGLPDEWTLRRLGFRDFGEKALEIEYLGNGRLVELRNSNPTGNYQVSPCDRCKGSTPLDDLRVVKGEALCPECFHEVAA